ncbi:MAG TPA: hypothetical protein PKD61_16745 [Polyangiaceae bacterium]|nr:hypothetical protein [Polyangiaceae bacterium]
MKVDRESFLAATLALSAALATGCDLPAEIATRLSPEKQGAAEPGAAPEAPAAGTTEADNAVDRGGDGFERGPASGPGAQQLPSPTIEAGGKQFAAPTKEAGGKFTAPTNEGAKTLPAPPKEAGMPAPTKEAGGFPAPTKEAGGYKNPPAPSKER